MGWHPVIPGASYDRYRHKDCGGGPVEINGYYGFMSWRCERCAWSSPVTALMKRGAEWYAEHFEGWREPLITGRLVWHDYGGKRFTETISELRLNTDGTVHNGGKWEPYD